MNPKIAHRGEQNGSFLKNLNSYELFSVSERGQIMDSVAGH